MNSHTPEDFDVIVVGGGPAGSTLAALTAMQGHRVLVLEKEKFPRYQIGESLLPGTINGICRLTGALDDVMKAGFTLKRGGTFKWGRNPDPWTFDFAVSARMAGNPYAFQVERSKFDKILLDNARRVGAEVREECAVTRVLADKERVTGAEFTDAVGDVHQVHGRYIVDASGNRSRIHRGAGGVREYSEFFQGLALFGYFAHGKRLPAPNSGNIFCEAFDSGWFWYIPLSDELTSVGAVVPSELADRVQGNSEQALAGLIAQAPIVRELLGEAKRVTEGQYGQIRVRKDYSYRTTRFWRPGMALIGDAACFVDPIFSSGVHLATYGALLAARSINSTLAGTIDENTAFEEFERRYRREFGVFYEYLMCFYEMHVGKDSYFWMAKKITNDTHNELESFIDLVAGVSSGEPALVGSEGLVNRFKERSREFSGAVDQIVTDEEHNMVPLLKTSVVQQALHESTRVQTAALLGNVTMSETPIFVDGLVASPDGMFWSVPEPKH
jgi:FAD-dependent halogenase